MKNRPKLKLPSGHSIPIDLSSIAMWDRFDPYVRQDQDWKNYFGYEYSQSDTLSGRIRYLSLVQMVRHVIRNNIKGSVAECGCGTGKSTYMIASILSEQKTSPHFYVFDSFEGLSPITTEDQAYLEGTSDVFGMRESAKESGLFAHSLETISPFLEQFEFIEFLKGWIPERFDQVAEETFAFVNLDLDIYEPTLKSLEFFFPRLAKGGVIHIDDYNFVDWPGTKKAVDEFLVGQDYTVFYEVPLGGAFLIK